MTKSNKLFPTLTFRAFRNLVKSLRCASTLDTEETTTPFVAPSAAQHGALSRTHCQQSSYPPESDATPLHRNGFYIKWPRAGGPAFVAPPCGLFDSAAYRDRYRPGANRTLYLAGCPGLKQTARAIRMPLLKGGACDGAGLLDRLEKLGLDEYGAGCRLDGNLIFDNNWNKWSAMFLRPERGPAPGSPVSALSRSLVVALPHSLTPEAFDEAYDAYLRHAAIDSWITTDDGRRLCARHGVNPEMFRRVTQYRYDIAPRISDAKELLIFRLDTDVDRLIEIAETIVLRHLGLIP